MGKRRPKSEHKQPVVSKQVADDQDPYSNRMFGQLFLALLFVLVAVVLQGYYRSPITALTIEEISPVIELSGVFTKNERLANGIKITKLSGPESIVEDSEGNLYTGLADGRIVKIAPSKQGVIGDGDVTTIIRIKIPEGGARAQTFTYGRPLGMRLHGDWLYFADAYYGVLKVNIVTSELVTLVAIDAVTPNLKFPDDLCLTSDLKKLYFTDASSSYSMAEMLNIGLTGICDGRIIELDLESGKLTAVVSDLCFPNGVQLTTDDSKLIVSETLHNKVTFYDTKTWEAGKLVRFTVSIDNIRPSRRGSLWVAGSVPRSYANVIMASYPALRQTVAGLFSSNQLLGTLQSKFNAVFEMSEDGEVLQSLYDTTGQLTDGLAQATELSDGRLVLGSYKANWLGMLNPGNLDPPKK